MDPRQRHLLQESWNALEDACYGRHHIQNRRIGMYVGVEEGDYRALANEASLTANHNAILAARLSYFLNLHGPTMAINTACSSSLVATHQAILSLRQDECDTAICAGVNLLCSSTVYDALYRAGMLSSDGKCYCFDKRANGMVPGEASRSDCATTTIRRRSRQRSYSRRRLGQCLNFDGKTQDITAPSGVSKKELYKSVYHQIPINPEDIDYIVTHGTGTKLAIPWKSTPCTKPLGNLRINHDIAH